MKYRLLDRGETMQEGDEALARAEPETWEPIPHWSIGMPYRPSNNPVRRVLDVSLDADSVIERLQARIEHSNYFNGVRFARLWHWAHEELSEELKSRFFCIVANGTADHMEQPTYAQQFNAMKHRMERAEAELAKLRNAGVQASAAPSDTERLRVVLATFSKREDNMPLTQAERNLLAAFDDRGSYTNRMKLSAIDDAVRGIDGPRRGPRADGSQKPNDAAAIPCAKAGSNGGVPGPLAAHCSVHGPTRTTGCRECRALIEDEATHGVSASDSVPVPPSPAPVVQVVEPLTEAEAMDAYCEPGKEQDSPPWMDRINAVQHECARKWGLSLKEPRE